MSSTLPATPADDGFDRHYAEKIWELIPEVYRNEDGLAATPGRLRALVEILAAQAAIARRSIDRLWADTHADEADDWAIPYIGALIGARPVSALNRPGQRVNLARTILYRRRQGTVRLAELLADDIADWDAVASEGFKRLIRFWHMLDGGPMPGPAARSPQWGYADLRSVRIADLLDHAHDEFSHYPDVRRHRGVLGRYGIAKVNLHLFRQYAFALTAVTPFRIADGLYTLDPSGRDVPLFQPGASATADCRAAREWEMRGPIPCHRLDAAGFVPVRDDAPTGLADALAHIYGRRFATEAGLLEAANAALAEDPTPPNALTDAQSAELIAAAMEEASPRHNLFPGGDAETAAIAIAIGAAATDPPLGPERLYGANLADWAQTHAVPGWVQALVDPDRGRLRLMAPLVAGEDVHVQRIHYGIFWPIGAGTHDRASGLPPGGFTAITATQPNFIQPIQGEHRFMDSRTFVPQVPADGIIEANGDLTLTAANGERPYIAFAPTGADGITLRATQPGLALVIDGLWLAVAGTTGGDTELRIDGTWASVTLRNLTIDPGGERAAAPAQPPVPIPAVTLVFAGAIDAIVIDHAILGRMVEEVTALDPCATDTVSVANSILIGHGSDATILLRNAHLAMDRCTVFGDIVTGRIDASQVLVDGRVLAEDRQSGCFRFSAAWSGGRVPHPYESHFFAGGLPHGTFVSRRFGDPGLAQLGPTAAEAIRTGGEGGTEIGAHSRALDPIKRADLRAKLDEFMPINAIAQLVFET